MRWTRYLPGPWVWAWLAALAALMISWGMSGRGLFSSLSISAQIASFLVVVGVGQLLVIATGNGNLDLSIPYVMAITGFLAASMTAQWHMSVLSAIVLGVLLGALVGCANYSLTSLLAIPAIVTTLAVGYILASLALQFAGGFSLTPGPSLVALTRSSVLGIPTVTWIAIGVSVLAWILLHRTAIGRTMLAGGQNWHAANFSLLTPRRGVLLAYVLSGALAGVAGVFLAGYAGGADLDIAAPYLLQSVAVVVIGGSLISGGRAFVFGVGGAALLLVLITSLFALAGLSDSYRYIGEGVVIIAVPAFGARTRST